MSAKVILVLCAQALFIQTAFSQCLGGRGAVAAPAFVAPACGSIGTYGGTGLANLGSGLSGLGASGCNELGYGVRSGYGVGSGYGGLAIEAIPTSGGALPVSSSSAIAPTGLSVASENVFEGALSVAGELPFLSAVALEGVLPSGGAGAVSYSCGNGVTAIESIGSGAGYGAAGTYGLGAGYGRGAGYALGGAYAPAAGNLGGDRACGCGVY